MQIPTSDSCESNFSDQCGQKHPFQQIMEPLQQIICRWHCVIFRPWYSTGNKWSCLCMFEQLSGLKIHFCKSEIFCLGWQNSVMVSIYIYSVANWALSLFGYLGLSMIYRKSNNRDWKKKRKGLKKYLVFGKENICVAEGRQITVD